MRKSERSCDTHTSSPTSIVACLVPQNQSFISFFIHKITRTRENFCTCEKEKKIRLQLIICTFACITSLFYSDVRERERRRRRGKLLKQRNCAGSLKKNFLICDNACMSMLESGNHQTLTDRSDSLLFRAAEKK